MRRIFTAIRPSGRSFQSTHPARGATPGVFCSKGGAGISIHAPREGCDGITAVYEELEQVFQSTHPARGATGRTEQASKTDEISIHAPREGCDRTRPDCNRTADISIHAPREGCDSDVLAQALPGREFQSTHPARGATRQWQTTSTQGSYFNPRTPRGVRQIRGGRHLARRPISIHAPREGCDSASAPSTAQSGHFNPRTPRGVRRLLLLFCFKFQVISIHAPREGCDRGLQQRLWLWLLFQSTHPARGATTSGRAYRALTTKFQSTHPARGATFIGLLFAHIYTISIHAPREGCDDPDFVYTIGETVISIHAPREGCDSKINGVSATTVKFQSTHPARGATRGCYCHAWVAGVFQSTHPARGATPRKNGIFGLPRYFNPRTPRGVRQAGCVFTFPCAYFNPRTPRGVRHVPRWRDIRTLTFQSTHPARGATLGIMRPIRKTPDFNPRTPRGVRLPVAMRIYNHYHFNPRTPRGVRLWNVLTIS